MTTQKKSIGVRFGEYFIGAFVGGLAGSLLAVYLSGHWDDQRERSRSLHTLVVSWHGAYLGNHRDSISAWLLTPEGVALRGMPNAEYGPALFEAFDDGRAPSTAILAIAGYFRSIERCIVDERCDAEQTYAQFGQTAREYHDLFGPLLRYLDCEKNYSGTEVPVLHIAKNRRDVLSGPERCKETSG